MSSSRRRVVAALVVALVASVAAAAFVYRQWREREDDRTSAASTVLTAYATGWADGRFTGVRFAEPGAVEDFAAATAGLRATAVGAAPGEVDRDGDSARGEVTVTWSLPGRAEWQYRVPVRLVERDGVWSVTGAQASSPWAPGLDRGERMTLERTPSARGDLLDRAGRPLLPQGTVYRVQLDPVQATPESAAGLEQVVGADAGSLVADLADATRAGSKAPIPVITYREADYAPRKARLDALAGVIAPSTTQPLGPTRTFGQPVLGSFGEVTKEVVDASEGRYVAGDRAGLSGLQDQYDRVLAGSPGLRVVTDTGEQLYEQPAAEGADVETTLDPRVQRAAEATLAGSGLDVPAAIVAVDVPTGEVLAAANSPTSGFDRALTGRYAPGSTFKVATTYAYLTRRITNPQARVPCPASATVDGRVFRNFAGESVSGSPTFFQDFTVSCNTAFVGLSARLGANDLQAAARALGIGADWGDTLGVAGAFPGSVPATTGGTDAAAAAIGQGRSEVSPLSLAVMAGSVGRGTFVPPVLVRQEDAAPTPAPLDGEAVAQLRSMMASVVSSGTADVLRGTPGGVVRAKTGTAEFGSDPDAPPRVWVVGYQGTVAFAVLVEQGRSGGTVAAPVAKSFLTALARG
ncbi:MAG: penicillin-binding transpeptidase domain-containing protein [Dermatophilaceae bacterium]